MRRSLLKREAYGEVNIGSVKGHRRLNRYANLRLKSVLPAFTCDHAHVCLPAAQLDTPPLCSRQDACGALGGTKQKFNSST